MAGLARLETGAFSCRLVGLVEAEAPRVLICAAPAGYGKSVLAAQLAARAGVALAIDCSASHDALGFARDVLTQLITENPTRSERIGAELLAAGDDAAMACDSAIATWRSTIRGADVFVFENADALDADAHAVLVELLANPGPRRMIVVCTRAPVVVPLSRELGPNDLLTVNAQDLRFDTEGIRGYFEGELDETTLRLVKNLSQGWPLAVSVLRRAHRMGRLAQFLDSSVGGKDLGRLEDYVASEIAATFDGAAIETLCMLVALRGPTVEELAFAVRRPVGEMRAVIATLPLVHVKRSGRARVHPLLSAYLTRMYPEVFAAALTRAIDVLCQRGESVRAARIALAAGDHERAAQIVEGGTYLVTAPPVDTADITSQLDRATLLRHPSLWNTAMLHRALSLSLEERRAEALAAWEALSPDATADVIVGVANNVVNVYAITGEWDRLVAFRRDAAARFRRAAPDGHPLIPLVETLIDGWVDAMRMRHVDLEQFLRDTAPLLATDYVHAWLQCDVVARVHTYRGDRRAQREALEHGLALARRSRIPLSLVVALLETANASWLAGEDDVFCAYVAEVEVLAAGSPLLRDGVTFFIDCARGRALSAIPRWERPYLRVFGWLVGAAQATTIADRMTLLDRALRDADGCRHPFVMILARLALAEADRTQAATRTAEARALLRSCDAPLFEQHFRGRKRDESPLEPFLRRFRSYEPQNALVVRVLEGTVTHGSVKPRLAPKAFALLAFLALADGPMDGEMLGEALWPEASSEAASGSLRVYVNRVRTRLADTRAVVVDKGRYSVGAHVRTDLGEIDRLTRETPEQPTSADIDAALRAYGALLAGPPAFLVDLPAFASLYAHVNTLLERTQAWLEAVAARMTLPDRARIALALDDAFENEEARR